MKIVLFGKNGQLGRELEHTLVPIGEVVAVGHQELDLCDSTALEAFIRLHKPQMIVNAAAYTAVDRAEQERDMAFQINCAAPGLMAELARELNAAFVHFSTDYVFDGTLGRPYVETDTPNPLNIYGKSKLAGEQAIQEAGGAYLILRTSWVYSMGTDNFVTKVLEWARQNETLRIVDDQISNPTWAPMLAEFTGFVMARGFEYTQERKGLFHIAGGEFASRFELAKQIVELDKKKYEQKVKNILPALTSNFPAPADRPFFSALNCDKFEKTFGLQIPNWQKSLQLAMNQDIKLNMERQM